MQTLYAHSRAVQQGVAYYAHPWDDGVTLLHRPAAWCPVIVDGGTLKTCIPASMAGMNSPAKGMTFCLPTYKNKGGVY